MGKKLTIVKPALREKKNGKIDPAPSNAYSHDEIEAVKGIKDKDVKRGFVTNEGKFVDRKKAAKIAKAAGEIKKPVKKLHSHDLRAGLGVKKKVLK
jgi:ribonucleotide monophosphatase NagD (HAD superfamily)